MCLSILIFCSAQMVPFSLSLPCSAITLALSAPCLQQPVYNHCLCFSRMVSKLPSFGTA